MTIPKGGPTHERIETPDAESDAVRRPSTSAFEGVKFLTDLDEPLDVMEFWDPPSASDLEGAKEKSLAFKRMMAALLDPRSIQWMWIIGGALMVLGLIIWLASLGVFHNPSVLAIVLTTGSLGILLLGCFVVLKTKYKVAGQALTFLACILLPLNLWFYDSQGIVTLEGGLWLGGVVCCALYVATLIVLRDPLFVYAVEGGATLTCVLLMANLGVARDTTYLSIFLLVLGLVSLHVERLFAPDALVFSRPRFGLPLFWCGHAQLAFALLLLLGTQSLAWLPQPARGTWDGNLLTNTGWLAGLLWLVGTYAYLYSDFVVRRVGIYIYLAVLCLMLAVVSFVGLNLRDEWLITVLAVTSVVVNMGYRSTRTEDERMTRALLPLALILSAPPVLIGLQLHMRATSRLLAELEWGRDTGWPFVVVMVVVAACNRLSAFLFRHTHTRLSWNYMFLSGAAVVVGAAGLLRALGVQQWPQQAPLLMLIPIAYLVAARLWRGHSPERLLGAVAHAAAAVILVPVLLATLTTAEKFVAPAVATFDNLLLGLVFVEASVFYGLAAVFRRKSANIYFAAVSACGAVWQWMCYFAAPAPYYTLLYAVLGLGLLTMARRLGIEMVDRYLVNGLSRKVIRGRGQAAFRTGNVILAIALFAAFLQGSMRLAEQSYQWWALATLTLTTAVGITAFCITTPSVWRNLNAGLTVLLTGIVLLTFYHLVDLTFWQTVEVACVAIGVVLLVASYVGRFLETEGQDNESVTLGFWLGSCLAALALLVAVLYHRFVGEGPSLIDELALLTVTIALLITGYIWQVKSTTLIGGTVATSYLVLLALSLAYFPQVAVGVYLAIGGAALFGTGVALSIYREELMELPDQIASRKGVFRIMNWR